MEAAAQLIRLDQPVFSPMISLRLRVLAQKEVERARRENIYPMAPTHPPRVLERSTSAPSWDMEVPQEMRVMKAMITTRNMFTPVPRAMEPLIFFSSPFRPFTT